MKSKIPIWFSLKKSNKNEPNCLDSNVIADSKTVELKAFILRSFFFLVNLHNATSLKTFLKKCLELFWY